MEILEYFSCSDKNKYLSQIEASGWRAAKYLAALLKENRLRDALGSWGNLYLLVNGDTLVSFITFSERDCISAPEFLSAPWLGFFHTAPEYRGNRYGQKLIDHVCNLAKEKGFKKVYIATDHIGLYEKYGFEYLENRVDVWGEDSRIYQRML